MIGTPVHPARPGERPFQVEDLWRVPRVSVPAPAPGGRFAVVAVKSFDMETNRGRSRLWRIAPGATPVPLTAPEHDSAEPAVSPDGARLAFVRTLEVDGRDVKQVHVMRLDGGEPERVTDLPLGALDPRWLPDGSSLVAVARLLRGFLTLDATRAEAARRRQAGPEPIATEARVYRYWDAFAATAPIGHLVVIDLATGAVRDLTPALDEPLGMMELGGHHDVAPDGSEVAFSAVFADGPEERLRSAVHVVATGGGPVRRLTADAFERAFDPRYTRDGGHLVFGVTEDPTFYADRVRLHRLDRRAGRHEPLLDHPELSPDAWEPLPGGGLALVAESRGRSLLYRLAGPGAAPEPVTATGTVAGPRADGRGALWLTHETLSAPAEAFHVAPGSEPRPVTALARAALDGVALGEVRELTVAGAGGEPVQGWLVRPPSPRDDGRPLPLVHVVHGGPHGITGDRFHARWNPHLFAAPGYLVACVNFQGSTSFGDGFARRIRGAWGERPAGDVLAVTDRLVADGLADPDRMALAGGSYGGYLVSWIATRTRRFRCAVNHAGVFDLAAQWATDVTFGRPESFGGAPWRDLEALDRYNPARHAAELATPMLVLHGERDFRVPVTQGLYLYNVLKAKGVPARLVYFQDENHWVLKPRNARAWYGEVLGWLARFLDAGAR